TPDLKPHIVPPVNACCGCGNGIKVETPELVENRGGLSSITYRIGEYAQFRASLHARLSSSDFPGLANLRTRDDDDFSIGLIDAFACSADVLTFYQERIANESYLRTAKERVSLQEMGKLVGYRLRAGVAAETWLAFALDTPPTPPPSLAPEPGNFVTGVPASLSLDIGFQVQSVPGPGEKPQVFETVEALAEARPAWNAMRPWLSEERRPGRSDTSTYLDTVRNNLKSGDALVFLGDEFLANQNSNNWDFRIVDRVELQPDNNRTLVTWKRGLGSIDPFKNPAQIPQVHVLRKRAAVFGHNAPIWRAMPDSYRTDYVAHFGGTKDQDDWPSFTLSPLGATATGGHVDLDVVYSDVQNDGYVILAKGGFNYPAEPGPAGAYVELYKVSNVAEVSRAEFAISGKVTRVELVGENYGKFQTSTGTPVRETSVFAASEPLSFAQYPVDDVVSDRVPVQAPADGLLPGRKLIVRGTRVSDGADVVLQATLVAAHPIDSQRCELEITPPLAAALNRDSVVVHANVTLASHGESVSQILGAGNASTSFQRFELKQLPLTYRAAPNEIGAAAELTVRVGDIAWSERPTMYGASPTERAYVLTTDEQGREFVVFGDGVSGARLPSGVNNVRAAYRKGLGIAGNVASGSLTQLMTRPLGLKSVSNPFTAEGGTDPESADDARDSIPITTRTLGRAVSLLDYEDFARSFSGIAKAQAGVLNLPAGPTVAITIAGPVGTPPLTTASPTWTNLLAALKSSGDPHVSVMLLALQSSTFRIGLKVKFDPAYDPKTVLAAVEAALRAHYAFDQRALGQPVQQSDVIAVAQNVAGVIAVDLARLYGGTQPLPQTYPSKQVRLLASRMRVQGGVAFPSELLTLDPGPLDQLEQMT
ncbi:MAG TPA: putative baseplate assembly protein, partial [Micropepsaceae bacterium]|nr:putative baseplate assembly protein [Micropepsaceae bacterium]